MSRPCEKGSASFDAALACGCSDCTWYTEEYGEGYAASLEWGADASDDGGWRGRLVALASNPAVILGRVVATFEDAVEGWLLLDTGYEVCCGLVNVVPESLNVEDTIAGIRTTARPATPDEIAALLADVVEPTATADEIAAYEAARHASQLDAMNEAYLAELADDARTWEDRLDRWREELETNL